MDSLPSSYSLLPPTELDGNGNLADLWSSANNGSYMQQITSHNTTHPTNAIPQASPNNPALQAPPSLAYARRYAASKPPYSCK